MVGFLFLFVYVFIVEFWLVIAMKFWYNSLYVNKIVLSFWSFKLKCISNILHLCSFLILPFFFFLDVDPFKSFYWICYSLASAVYVLFFSAIWLVGSQAKTEPTPLVLEGESPTLQVWMSHLCADDFLPLLYACLYQWAFPFIIFFFLVVAFCFLSREVPLSFVAKLVWWCWILLSCAYLWSFWLLY